MFSDDQFNDHDEINDISDREKTNDDNYFCEK